MAANLHLSGARDFGQLLRLERNAFAAKIRIARALLGWSQGEFGHHVGLTQRAVHKLEQGDTEPRRGTIRAIEWIWRRYEIEFEDLADGSFRVSVRPSLLQRDVTAKPRRRRAARPHHGITALSHRPASYRA